MASPADKVALYALIRRESRAGLSSHAIERKHRVSRRTVARALASAWPEPCRELPRRSSRVNALMHYMADGLRRGVRWPGK